MCPGSVFRFEEGIAEQRLASKAVVEYPFRLAAAVDALTNSASSGCRARRMEIPCPRWVITPRAIRRWVVERRPSAPCRRKEVIVTPAPEFIAVGSATTPAARVASGAVGDPTAVLIFRLVHGVFRFRESGIRRKDSADARPRFLRLVGKGDQRLVEIRCRAAKTPRVLAVSSLVGVIPHAHFVAGHVAVLTARTRLRRSVSSANDWRKVKLR